MVHRTIFVFLLVLGSGIHAAQQRSSPALPNVQIFGHRGFTRDVPENSIPALEAAAALDLAGSEIDLRTTRDGAIVLMHDATLDRTTTGSGPVSNMTAAEISALKLETADGRVTEHRVPTFDAIVQFMSRHPPFRVAFDAKEIDLEAVGRRVIAAGLQERVIFFIDTPQAVDRARKVKSVDPRLRISVNLLDWWKIEGLPTFARRALDANALFASEYYFPRAGFTEAKEAGAEVQVYIWGDHDLPARFHRAVALGADLVSTDRPDVLVPLTRRSTRPKS
jgi:glycerophosphoryl diester phosphodiesterase